MSTHRRSVRREIRSAEKGLKRFDLETGPVITYYEFDAARTTSSDVYGEGQIEDIFDTTLPLATPGLSFKPPKYIRCVWWRFNPATVVQDEAGEYTLDTSTLRFTADGVRKAGFLHPLSPEAHYNDRYFYQGRLYRVEQYIPKGQMYGTAYLMIDIDGRQIKPEELETDQAPFAEAEGTETPWTPGQLLDWPITQVADETQPPAV